MAEASADQDRMIMETSLAHASHRILEAQSLEDQLNSLEKEDQIERLLEDLKSRQPRLN